MSTFPTPSEIQQRYFTILKSIKPSINVNDQNSDFVIRGKVFAGVASGLYGDQSKVDNDTWVSSCREEALLKKGADLGIERNAATKATSSQVRITGINGVEVAPGDLTFLYVPSNVIYTNTTAGTIANGVLDVTIQCEASGTVGNVAAEDELAVVSPPSGVNPAATILVDISGGSDIETVDSYRARLLSHIQQPPAGGNEEDYKNFCYDADDSVRSVTVKRFGRGLGTVDCYLMTGTTDIDKAVTNGQTVSRIPSSSVIDTVQAYLDEKVPLTDSPAVYAPTEITVDVTVDVALADGVSLTMVPSDATNNPLGLTVLELIKREVGRALYKTPIGGHSIPGQGSGYVTAAYIEQILDTWLSESGNIPVLADRQIRPLNGTHWDLPLTGVQIVAPGTITVSVGIP